MLKEVLSIDSPRFEEFCEKLSGATETLKSKKCSECRIPRGHFETDIDGNQWYVVDIPPFEKSQLVRATLEEMGDIDIKGTLKFFNAIDHFCECEHCKQILDLIRPMDVNA